MNDESIEQEIQDKGLTAPRVTPEDVTYAIRSEHYFTAHQGVIGHHSEAAAGTFEDGELRPVRTVYVPGELNLLTLCVLVMRNGFTVVGKSACASPENFDAELGRKIARNDAVQQVWPLMGYALKETLHQQTL